VTIAHSQTRTIPVVPVSSPITSSERFLAQPSVRHLPDGRALVSDPAGKRLLVFDSTLSRFTISADSANVSGALYPSSGVRVPLIPYLGDSTLLTDVPARAYLVIDPTGKIGRAAAPPKPTDLTTSAQAFAGSPGTDPRGRLVYRAGGAPIRSPQPGDPPNPSTRDTVGIVRADFDTRAVDTIATYSIPRFVGTEYVDGPDGKKIAKRKINPVPQGPDEWALLTDGTLAIARVHDYHVDYVTMDGVKTSGPKLPFDWKRLTDADKAARIDSMKRVIDSVNSAGGRPYGFQVSVFRSPDGTTRIDSTVPAITWASFNEIADYVPPIRQGSVKADADNNLWILPATSTQIGPGLLYDVVNRKGELFQRVRLPANSVLIGFGKGGIVYFAQTAGPANTWLLGRGRIARSAVP
jgi:hypothetical protein